MDSLTQALLGATTFGLVQDRRIGKKSLWIGAAAGTLPDLDVFLRVFYDEVDFLLVHRGFSHSIFFAVIMSVLLGQLFHRWFRRRQPLRSWYFAFFLAIFTHPLLDVCTSYGTQLLNPLTDKLFSTHNIFVIEPSYTLILLIGFVILISLRSTHRIRQRVLHTTMLLSCLFLLWTFVSQAIAKHEFTSELARQNIQYEELLVAPTPLNTLLWDGVARTDSGYYLADYSLMDDESDLRFSYVQDRRDLLPLIDTLHKVERYMHYCDGYPLVQLGDDSLIRIFAAKYGPVGIIDSPRFMFPLVLDMRDPRDEHIHIDHESLDIDIDAELLSKLWRRVMGHRMP